MYLIIFLEAVRYSCLIICIYIYTHIVPPPPSSKDTAGLDNLPKTKRDY